MRFIPQKFLYKAILFLRRSIYGCRYKERREQSTLLYFYLILITYIKISFKQIKEMSSLNFGNNLEAHSPSGESSPVFNWSPLPPKRILNFISKESEEGSCDFLEDTPDRHLYPNCDVDVWLRSCEKDIINPLNGKVTGKIPSWLNGTLFRNGPGSLKVGDEQFQHIFDSSALLHRFAITNGQVTYQCRFLQSDVYKRNWEAKRIVFNEFGTKAVPDPCHSIFKKVSSLFNMKENGSDNAMISVYPFCDELYAFSETPIIYKVNKETLETEKKVDVGKNVSIVNHTSHPHVLKDGTVFNLGMSVSAMGPTHNIICFPPKENLANNESMFEKAHIVASIPARWSFNPSYMHTFGITEHYFIIVEQPLSLSIPSIITNTLRNEPLAGCFRWYHEEKTQINVLSRATGKLVQCFQADSFFYLHIINQYETYNYIVLDICCYRDPAMLDCMYVETMRGMQNNPDYAKMFRGRPLRFILPMNADRRSTFVNHNLIDVPNSKAEAYMLENGSIFVKPERICDLGCETPRIYYEKHLGKMYQYFYAISSDVDANNPGTIIKVDTINKSVLTWCETSCYPSEPIFVPAPNPQSEDDGVVLSAMVWGQGDTNHAGLLVLDAKTFKELGRAEFFTPSPVPKCLHGWYLPSEVGVS